MVYAPPLIKPPLPPLRPPVAPPYRPPVLAPPPTQIDPGYDPPTLLPPTDIDLKGIVCVYSNAPLWEPKKIRYRYPGENWKEIAGDRYTTQISNIAGGDYPSTWRVNARDYRAIVDVIFYDRDDCSGNATITTGIYENSLNSNTVSGTVTSVQFSNIPACRTGTPTPGNLISAIVNYKDLNNTNQFITITGFTTIQAIQPPPLQLRRSYIIGPRSYTIEFTEQGNPQPPVFKCTFKVFNILNQEILSITRDDCPEVIVVPERCYFKDENERLVARVIQTLLDPPLRVEYQGHCATVWKDGIIALPPYPLQIYKECSDNPNCPPPRIRFDQKCEEKCEQCPPGTAIKVLLGSRIACVDAVGCVLKSIKYKPGCNKYDCVCR